MVEQDALCIVMTTCAAEDAAGLAADLVEQRLAACVQRFAIHSTYRWEGAVHEDPETLLLIKSRRKRFGDVSAYLAAHHPYDEPEIILVPVADASAGYADWLMEATGNGPDSAA